MDIEIDITKLSPEPWYYSSPRDRNSENPFDREAYVTGPKYLPINDTVCMEPTDSEFFVLSRRDHGVRQRRHWHTEYCEKTKRWFVPQLVEHSPIDAIFQDGHDVGLLTKADEWYKENVEKEKP